MHYLIETEEEFLKEVKIENIFKDEEDTKERKKTIINRRKESFLEKKIHPVFWKGTKEIRDEEATCQWLRKGTLKRETEVMFLVAQNQALRTKWMRYHTDKEVEISPTCRVCGLADKPSHI
jgi:membrane-associated HD superfamily phosphohydrolase